MNLNKIDFQVYSIGYSVRNYISSLNIFHIAWLGKMFGILF